MALKVPLAQRVATLEATPVAERSGVDAPVSAVARDASVVALDRGETHYTDRPGIPPLRSLVARRLSERFGIEIDGDKGVVITCGATEARFVAMQQLVGVGARVVALAKPERIASACIVRGAEAVGPDAETEGVTAVYLTEGADPAARERWLAFAVANECAVVFEPGAGDERHPAADGAGALTVTIGGIGHDAGLEGWRVGYLAAPVAKAGPLRDFKQALTLCTTNLSQWGALAHLEASA